MPRLPLQTGFFQSGVTGCQARQEAEITSLTILTPIYSQTIRVTKDIITPRALRTVAYHRGQSGSSGRIRTYDQSVNSRPLYH